VEGASRATLPRVHRRPKVVWAHVLDGFKRREQLQLV